MNGLSFINKVLFIFNYISLILLIFSCLSPYLNPIYFWPISFIGLIFPFLYIINIFFFIYWGLNFKKQIWLNIIILLIGFGNFRQYIGTSPNTFSNEENIKLLTFNVRLFNKYNWLNQVDIQEKTYKFFKNEKLDILCIQEFYDYKDINLDFSYEHLGQEKKEDQEYLVIYSNYPQINKGTVNLNGKDIKKTCIYSDIIIKKDTLRVYNIHLASNWFKNSDYLFIKNPINKKIKEGITGIMNRMKESYKKRAVEVKAIKEHIQLSPYHVIVCGDFNDTPLSYAYSSIKGDLVDAFSVSGKGIGESFVNIPGLRIDYILHESKFNSTNYQKHHQIFSDHYAISCEIIIP